MSQITIKLETVEDDEHKEACNNNGLKNQSTRELVSQSSMISDPVWSYRVWSVKTATVSLLTV